MEYKIQAHWEVGKRGRPAHVFYVNGGKVGTRVENVFKAIPPIVPRKTLRTICGEAKWDGNHSFSIYQKPNGDWDFKRDT